MTQINQWSLADCAIVGLCFIPVTNRNCRSEEAQCFGEGISIAWLGMENRKFWGNSLHRSSQLKHYSNAFYYNLMSYTCLPFSYTEVYQKAVWSFRTVNSKLSRLCESECVNKTEHCDNLHNELQATDKVVEVHHTDDDSSPCIMRYGTVRTCQP